MTTTRSTEDLSVTTTEHPHVARIREAFAAFGRGDLEAVREGMAPDATWTNAGRSPLAGSYRGWEEISGMFGQLFEFTGGTFRTELVDAMATDRHGVAVYDETSTVDGRTETHRFALVEELGPDGRVTATRALAYDQDAADALLIG